jgi:hypothetical protein
MAKYYISSGTLQIIRSTNKSHLEAACDSVWELNENDTLDEYFYVNERGFRDYTNAGPETEVFTSNFVLRRAGWSVEPRRRKKED